MAAVQQELGLTDEQFGKLRLFNRILISYNDFKEAHEIASLLVDGNLYRNYPKENRHLVIALNMAARKKRIGVRRQFLTVNGMAYETRRSRGERWEAEPSKKKLAAK
jgi:hypothetical protein